MRINKVTKLTLLLLLILLFVSGCDFDTAETHTDQVLESGGAYKSEIRQSSTGGSLGFPDGSANENTEHGPEIDVEFADNPTNDNKTSSKSENNDSYSETQKIISIYSIIAESKSFENDVDVVNNKVHELGGYISSHNIKTNEEQVSRREAEMLIRIPKDQVDKAIEAFKKDLHITIEASNAIDITDRFYDAETRIKNLEKQEERLMELYDKTTNVEEMLMINDRLNVVTTEKEILMKSYLDMEDKVTYSTINLKVHEVSEFTMNELAKDSSQTRIMKAFNSSFIKAKAMLINILVFLANSTPAIILVALGLFIYKKYLKKLSAIIKNNLNIEEKDNDIIYENTKHEKENSDDKKEQEK